MSKLKTSLDKNKSPNSSQPPSKTDIVLSLLWPMILLAIFLLVFTLLSLTTDQVFNLPKPLPEDINEAVAVIIWLIFLPIYLTAVYQLLTEGKGSPNPIQASPIRLVTNGIYGVIRHPMNLAYPFLALGISFYLNSLTFLILVVPAITYLSLYHALVVQEKELKERYGKEYEQYKEKVPALIPKIKRKLIFNSQ